MIDTHPPSPRWSSTTKLVVALAAIVLLGWVVVRFQVLITPLVMALMLAYLLNPLITWLAKRARGRRTAAAAVVYVVLLLVVAAIATGLGIYVLNQLITLGANLVRIIGQVPARLDELTHSRYEFFGFVIDLRQFDFAALYAQILVAVQPALSRLGQTAGDAVASAAEFFGWALFVIVISFYIAKDMPNLRPVISRYAADPGYHHDVERLMKEFTKIWNDFLRGQALLAIVIGVVSWVGLSVLGVRNAVALAILSGLLELVPTIGPIISGIVAVIVVLFQESNWLGLDPISYAVVVTVFFVIIQQLENNFLVPRIIGDTLNIHPVLIMCGAIMGASLAGIPGILFSAPVMATLRLLARYSWRKLLDLPPFPAEDSKPAPPPKPLFSLGKLPWWFSKRRPPKIDSDAAVVSRADPKPDSKPGP